MLGSSRSAIDADEQASCKRFVRPESGSNILCGAGNIIDDTGRILAIASPQLEFLPSKEQIINKVTFAEPERVMRVAIRSRSFARLGPLDLITLSHESDADAASRIVAHSLRLNEIIPPNSSARRVVFVEKADLPDEFRKSYDKAAELFQHMIVTVRYMKSEGEAEWGTNHSTSQKRQQIAETKSVPE
jgi:hypothetical protein